MLGRAGGITSAPAQANLRPCHAAHARLAVASTQEAVALIRLRAGKRHHGSALSSPRLVHNRGGGCCSGSRVGRGPRWGTSMTSRNFTIALASLALLAAQPSAAAPAGRAGSSAANGVEEVGVTGSRIRDYDPTETPHVSVLKRADNLLVEIKVVCDTRDKPQRLDEIRATLRNMIRTAALVFLVLLCLCVVFVVVFVVCL